MIVWKGIYVDHTHTHELDDAIDRLAKEHPEWCIDRDIDWEFDPDANADEPQRD